jgi:hypothetical protein
MYAFNSTVMVDHDGHISYIDARYPGSFHDVNILRHSHLLRKWRQYFTRLDDYFEYLLGDDKYQILIERSLLHWLG